MTLDYMVEEPTCVDGWYWGENSLLWLVEFWGNGSGLALDFEAWAENEALGYPSLRPTTPAIEIASLGLTRAATCAEVEAELDKMRDEFDASWREDVWTIADRKYDERNN